MSGVRAAQSAKKLLKVRTGGLRVGLAEDEKYSGTTFGVSGASDVKVVWDDIENMGWGEYPTGTDKDGNESFALTLLAAHSYLMITGCGGPEAADDANVLSGLYVMDPSSFLPSYYQYEGVGRLCYQEEEEKWILFNKMEGCMLNWYYECESETLDVPEKGWCVLSGWDEEYANPPTITKHELQEGQDVKLRKLHPDAHIPADKYPGGAPMAFNHGDVCTVEKIDGLFFAPKIAPDQWIPVRAAIPLELLEDNDEVQRLANKKDAKKAGKKEEPRPKAKSKAAAKKAAGSESETLALLKTLVAKVENLEAEVKKLQK